MGNCDSQLSTYNDASQTAIDAANNLITAQSNYNNYLINTYDPLQSAAAVITAAAQDAKPGETIPDMITILTNEKQALADKLSKLPTILSGDPGQWAAIEDEKLQLNYDIADLGGQIFGLMNALEILTQDDPNSINNIMPLTDAASVLNAQLNTSFAQLATLGALDNQASSALDAANAAAANAESAYNTCLDDNDDEDEDEDTDENDDDDTDDDDTDDDDTDDEDTDDTSDDHTDDSTDDHTDDSTDDHTDDSDDHTDDHTDDHSDTDDHADDGDEGDNEGDGCFVAGTSVWTSEGVTPIDQIGVDHQVLAFDLEKQTVGIHRVLKIFPTLREKILVLDFGIEKIRVTPPHRFFKGGWTRAEHLKVGDKILCRDGEWRPLLGIEVEEGSRPVFNFRVADMSNYFVGAAGLLVHNDKKVDDGDDDRGDDFAELRKRMGRKNLLSIQGLKNKFTPARFKLLEAELLQFLTAQGASRKALLAQLVKANADMETQSASLTKLRADVKKAPGKEAAAKNKHWLLALRLEKAEQQKKATRLLRSYLFKTLKAKTRNHRQLQDKYRRASLLLAEKAGVRKK